MAIWQPIALQVLFFILLLVEFILPSAGILTTLSILTLVGSWVMIVNFNIPSLFSIVLIADIILISIVLVVGFRLMRKSPMAHNTSLADAQTSKDLSSDLVGKLGVTTSILRPYGKVQVESEIYDAVSEGEYVEIGQSVKILSVSRNTLTVTNQKEL